MSKEQPQDPFSDLLDSIRNLTIRRADTETNWNDVWQALLNSEPHAKILQERGIYTSSLASEIRFLSVFKNYDIGAKPQIAVDEFLRKAYEELKTQIEHLVSLMEHEKEDVEKSAIDLMNVIMDQFARDEASYSGTPLQEQKARILSRLKEQIITSSIDRLGTFAFHEEMEDGKRRLIGYDRSGDKIYAVDAKIEKELLKAISKNIANYLDHGGKVELHNEETPLEILESIAGHPLHGPSPADVVDAVIDNSGIMFTRLLYRNGLRSPDSEYKDPLAEVLPDYEVQDIMHRAFRQALSENAKFLAPRHIAIAISTRTEVHIHLSGLGIKDLMEFDDKVHEQAKNLRGEKDKSLKIYPQIPDDIYPLINRLNMLYKGEENAIALLHNLIKTDKEIDGIYNKAGLTRAMLKTWPKKYEEDKKADKKAKKTKKPDEERSLLDIFFGGPRRENNGPYEIPDDYLESLIKKYCIDYTKLAKQRKFDPMIGNEQAMEDVITILQKRGKKNPIMIGEPGIGKSKILEGLAQRIVRGNVPKVFVGSRLLLLDLSVMNDSPYRGVFEERANSILKGVSERNALGKMPPILLGLEELGENMSAGGHSQGDGFKGIAKPYLTSGDLITISNATKAEFNTKIEKDSAFARRLQPVMLIEPTIEETTEILLGQKSRYSSHHKIRIPNHLMVYIAENAGKHVHTTHQPDKSIDILDHACSIARTKNAKTLQKEHINLALAAKSGIPVGFFSESERERYASIDRHLSKRVLDQPEAIQQISSSMKRAKAGLKEDNSTVGNYLFVGPTGVGKTELTIAIAEFLLGSSEDTFLNRFNMGEFQDKHSIARLIGSDPGLVQSDEGGLLVNAVRRRPFCVNLFDEAEKAHPDVFSALLSPFSGGKLTDGRGMTADFSHTLNIMTVNLGAQEIMETAKRRSLDPFRDYEEWQAMARPIYEFHVQSFFTPEFRNRLDGIIYLNSLKKETLRKLVQRQFETTAGQIKNTYGLNLTVSPAFRDDVLEKGYDIRYGARPLKRAWNEVVGTPLADWLLRQSALSLRRGEVLEMLVQGAASNDESSVVPLRRPQPKPVENGELKPSFVLRTASGPQ